MEHVWTDPEAYNDLDLARTVGHFDGFFSQAISPDGRGLTDFAPPVAVRAAVDEALTRLGQSPLGDTPKLPRSTSESPPLGDGSFATACTRLAASAGNPLWREVTNEVLTIGLRELGNYTAQRRNERSEVQQGEIVGLHTSKGGVPKKAITSTKVNYRGFEGDVQRSRQHHGRPWQALCLWADETISKLQNEGHPIARGVAGENITLAGIDFAQATCGSLLVCGDLVAELTLFALPCSKNAKWFLDGDFNRMHHAVEPGVSRMYASVLASGSVRVGDAVQLHLR